MSIEIENMVTVVMGESDWEKVIGGMEYLAQFNYLATDSLSPADAELIAESIQDVLDGAR